MVEPLKRFFLYDRRDPPADAREDMIPKWCKKCVKVDTHCNSTQRFRWPSPRCHRCLPESEWPPHAAQELSDAVLKFGWSLVGRGVSPQDLIAAAYRLQEVTNTGSQYQGVHAIAVAPDGQFFLINCRQESCFVGPLFPQNAFAPPLVPIAKAPTPADLKASPSPSVPRPDALLETGTANRIPSASHMNRHENHNPKGAEDILHVMNEARASLDHPNAGPKAKSSFSNATWFDPKHAARGPPAKAVAKRNITESKAKARAAATRVIEQQELRKAAPKRAHGKMA